MAHIFLDHLFGAEDSVNVQYACYVNKPDGGGAPIHGVRLQIGVNHISNRNE